ncbi:MAG: beta-glycosidase [Bacteroidales bacterium]|nr:beta-glycosidase [Bacteroidales bacterium]
MNVRCIFILMFFLLLGCCVPKETPRAVIILDGIWQFAIDSVSVGETDRWYLTSFTDSIKLPGTTDLAKKGNRNNYQCKCLINAMGMAFHDKCRPYEDSTAYHYTREYPFVGKAWYRKEVTIPAEFANKVVLLTLERSKVSRVWVDSTFVGQSSVLSAKQIFDISDHLKPGKHTITIMVDNDPSLVSTGFSHIYSYDTQSNWNGLLGELSIKAFPKCFISQTNVFPDVENQMAVVKLRIENRTGEEPRFKIVLSTELIGSTNTHKLAQTEFFANLSATDSVLSFNYPMGESPELWSEFNPALYKMKVRIETSDKNSYTDEVSFGMRKFVANGTQFQINGNTIFLRGKNDGCVFPLTGYPPMDTAEWIRYYRICKDYGINHVRFHSWCPPRAAFTAADVVGIYIQAELPYWGNYNQNDSSLINFMKNEGATILQQNGNSPSFCMLTLGNENNGCRSVMDGIVADFKLEYPRQLFSFGTNSKFTNPMPGTNDDFWVTVWTNGNERTKPENHVRSAFATNEDETSGLINAFAPSTNRNYIQAIKNYKLPIIGHEIGQFQIYPNYKELVKYTGVLKPWNYEVFKRGLEKAGMGHLAEDFFYSTGQSCLIQYREEIEAALRTPGFGGFQMLDLQDYPGQATALVGILDPFMDSKGIIEPYKFREFCSEVVPLAKMSKYCYYNTDTLKVEVCIANYGLKTFEQSKLVWRLYGLTNGLLVASGELSNIEIPSGNLTNVGKMLIPLITVSTAEKLQLSIQVDGTPYKNEYPVWVYPGNDIKPDFGTIVVASKVDVKVISALKQGKNVLLFPDHQSIKDKSLNPQFINEFWNWYMFQGICKSNNRPISAGTMGLLIDNKHPLFKSFPTETHSNWQWWNLSKNARPLILDSWDKDIQPIVQVIDNVYRNHKLGMLFEFRCGTGKVLVCMSDLKAVGTEPEVNQLYNSIEKYMQSDEFNPQTEIELGQIVELL